MKVFIIAYALSYFIYGQRSCRPVIGYFINIGYLLVQIIQTVAGNILAVAYLRQIIHRPRPIQNQATSTFGCWMETFKEVCYSP